MRFPLAPGGFGLWPRLALAVTLGFVILFGVFALASLLAVEDSTSRILAERQVLAEMAGKQMEALLEQGFHELEKATTFAPFDPRAPNLYEEAHLLAHTYGRIGILSLGVYFLDRTGRVVMTEPSDPSLLGFDLSQIPPFKEAIAFTEPHVSPPFRDIRTGKPTVAIIVPVSNRQGELVSFLIGLIDLADPRLVQPLEQAKKLGHTGHGEIVDRNGTVLASTEEGEFMQPGEHLEFYLRMMQEGRNGVETVPYERGYVQNSQNGPKPGEMHVMAFAFLPKANWGVTVGGTEEETFAPVKELQGRLLLLGFLSLAALLAITLLGARRLVRPIKSLTQASQQIASGDLDRPIHLREVGEIGVLAASLEQMRVKLRLSLEEITRWGKELESRVKERTWELEQRNRELSATASIAAACSQSLNLAEVLDGALERTLETLRLSCGQIFLLDKESGRFELRARRGVPVFHTEASFLGGEGIPGLIAQGGGLWNIDDLREAPQLLVGMEASLPFASAAGVPITAKNEVVGAMVFFAETKIPVSQLEVRLLTSIGNQIGIAVENAKLVEELARLEAMRALDQLKGEFVSSISHDLRTPLGFIKGYATTLLRKDILVEDETRQEFLGIICEETEKLQELIDNLLDASRLQAGALSVEKKPFNLAGLVERLLEKARTTTGKHNLVSSLTASVPVLADSRRIEQVMVNLLDNAIKYSPRGGRITIQGAVDEKDITISVADEGEGIPPEDLGRIFDAFYRRDDQVTHSVRGSGLGLAICRGIVEAHGGRIWAESVAGKGSTFSFSLPLDRDHKGTLHPPASVGSRGKKRRSDPRLHGERV